jgi:hypothetical protein
MQIHTEFFVCNLEVTSALDLLESPLYNALQANNGAPMAYKLAIKYA